PRPAVRELDAAVDVGELPGDGRGERVEVVVGHARVEDEVVAVAAASTAAAAGGERQRGGGEGATRGQDRSAVHGVLLNIGDRVGERWRWTAAATSARPPRG